VAPNEAEIGCARVAWPGIGRIEDIAARDNVGRALQWLAWLRKSFPETTFIAPWIASILSGEQDSDPKQREAGLVDDCAVVERCDGMVLCGGRISNGMDREARHGGHRELHGCTWFSLAPTMGDIPEFKVYDLTPEPRDSFIRRPTWSVIGLGPTFEDWYRWIVETRR
jgi:hypothetical protein